MWTSEFYSPFKHFVDTAVVQPVIRAIDLQETEPFHLKQGVEGGALEDIANAAQESNVRFGACKGTSLSKFACMHDYFSCRPLSILSYPYPSKISDIFLCARYDTVCGTRL